KVKGRLTSNTSAVRDALASVLGGKPAPPGAPAGPTVIGGSRSFEGHGDWVWSGVFSPDGRQVLSSSRDQTVRLWEVETGRLVRRFDRHKAEVKCAVLSPDARLVLSGGADRALRLWEAESGREVRRLNGHKDLVTSVAFAPDGRRALSTSRDRTLRLSAA